METNKLSRDLHLDTEWKLNSQLLKEALTVLETQSTVDSFASRTNAKFPVYVSYFHDPCAYAADAFLIHWGDLMFYCFPPFSILPGVLRKIRKREQQQQEQPMLMNMLTARPVPLSAREELLSQPCNKNLKHPLHKKDSATRMQSVRDRFRSQGLSEDATEFIMSSWRESIQQMYDVYIRQWVRYACGKKKDQFSPPLTTAIVCIRAFKSDGSGRARFLKCTLFWSTINL